jgi:hypothetical protein
MLFSFSIIVGNVDGIATDLLLPFGYRGSLVELPRLVVIFFTCSGLVATGNVAANCAIFASIFYYTQVGH